MKMPTKISIAILACAVIAVHPAGVLGWSHNEHNVNNTGLFAYDVVKVLEGHYSIPKMMTTDFLTTESYQKTIGGMDVTILRWTNGVVADGEAGDVCFTAIPQGQSASHAKILAAWWTDINGEPMGSYLSSFSANINFANLNLPVLKVGNFQAAQINVNTSNPDFWEDGDFTLSGTANPLTIQHLWAAVVDGALGPEDLFVDTTINDPVLGSSFVEIATNLTINGDDEAELPLYNMPAQVGQSVVLVADLGNGNYDLYNFEVPEPCSMALLGLGSLAMLRYRKKR